MCVSKAKNLVEQEKAAMRADIEAVTSRVMDDVSIGENAMLHAYMRSVRTAMDLKCALQIAAAMYIPVLGMSDAEYKTLVHGLCEHSQPIHKLLRGQFRAMHGTHTSKLPVSISGKIIEAARYMQRNDQPLIPSNRFHFILAVAKFWQSVNARNNPDISAHDMAAHAMRAVYEAKKEINNEQKMQSDNWVKIRGIALSLLEEKTRAEVREHIEASQSMVCMHDATVRALASLMLNKALSVMWSLGEGRNAMQVAQDVAHTVYRVVAVHLVPRQRSMSWMFCPDYPWCLRAYDRVIADMEQGASGVDTEGGASESQGAGSDVPIPDSPESPPHSEGSLESSEDANGVPGPTPRHSALSAPRGRCIKIEPSSPPSV